jgi:hypothetical protein
MGTYDTIGGRAASPDVDTLAPSALVEAVLGVLEEAGVNPDVNDKVAELIEADEGRRLMPHPQPQQPDSLFGRTVEDALRFLADADKVWLMMPVTSGGATTILAIPPDVVITALATRPLYELLPCEFDTEAKLLAIGGAVAIERAEAQA